MVPTQANADQLYRLSAKMSAQNTYAGPKSIFTVRYNPNLFNYNPNKQALARHISLKHYFLLSIYFNQLFKALISVNIRTTNI